MGAPGPLAYWIYGGIFLFGLLSSLGAYMWHYARASTAVTLQREQEAQHLLEEAETAVSTYHEMLISLGQRIVTGSAWRDESSLSKLLKQFYRTAVPHLSSKIGFSDLRWYPHDHKRMVTRHGTVPHADTLSSDMVVDLQTQPNKLYLTSSEQTYKGISEPVWHARMGIHDSAGKYRGHVRATLDVPAWLATFKSQGLTLGPALALIDTQHHILVATDTKLVGQRVELSLQAVTPVLDVMQGGYHWIRYHPFPASSAALLVGYDRSGFLRNVMQETMPLWIVLWGASLGFAGLFARFHHNLRQEMQASWNETVDRLRKENHLIHEKCHALEAALSKSELWLDAYQASHRATEQLMGRIHGGMAFQLTAIRALLKTVQHACEGSKAQELLGTTLPNLIYLSQLCVGGPIKERCITSLIEEILPLFAKECVMRGLTITPTISPKLRSVPCQGVLLQQMIVSLLRKAVEHVRPRTELRIEATPRMLQQQEHLAISIAYDGFQLLSAYHSPRKHEGDSGGSPLHLDLETIQALAAMQHGALDTQYGQSGQVFTLLLPIEPAPAKTSVPVVEGGNIVQFKKRP